jgi:hypothetical protein
MDDERCGEIMRHTKERQRCEMEMGHAGWHSVEDGAHKWTTSDRADLERRVKDAETGWLCHLTNVLEDVGEGLHSESLDEARATVADYERKRDAVSPLRPI